MSPVLAAAGPRVLVREQQGQQQAELPRGVDELLDSVGAGVELVAVAGKFTRGNGSARGSRAEVLGLWRAGLDIRPARLPSE